VVDGGKPEFEQPDVESLRKAYYHQSLWSRIGGIVITVLTSRTTWTVILALLILAVLVFGYLALGR
jgi:hypothetical protein